MSVNKIPGTDVASALAMVTSGVALINYLVDFIRKLIAQYNLPDQEIIDSLEKCHQITETGPEKLLDLIKTSGG